ncbi:hypothetical protein D3C73_1309210 [compost metagenome]
MNGTHQIKRDLTGPDGLRNTETVRDEAGNPERRLGKGDVADHSLRSVFSQRVIPAQADPDACIHESEHGAREIVYHMRAAVLQVAGIGFGSQREIEHNYNTSDKHNRR